MDNFLQGKTKINNLIKEEGSVDEFAIDIIKSASTTLMDNRKGNIEAKTFKGEPRSSTVAGYIPPADTTEDQKNNTPHRPGISTDVKMESVAKSALTLFDLIQAELEEDSPESIELDNLLDKYYDEKESDNADPTEE